MKETGIIYWASIPGKEPQLRVVGKVGLDRVVEELSESYSPNKYLDQVVEIIDEGSEKILKLFAQGGFVSSWGRILAYGLKDTGLSNSLLEELQGDLILKRKIKNYEGLLNPAVLPADLRPHQQAYLLRENLRSVLGYKMTFGGNLHFLFGDSYSDLANVLFTKVVPRLIPTESFPQGVFFPVATKTVATCLLYDISQTWGLGKLEAGS